VKKEMNMKEIKYYQSAKGRIEYVLTGKGPVVLFFHGGHDSCLGNFRYKALLDNGFSVLVPSRPGYSGTDISVGKTAEETAEAAAGLLTYLQIDRVSVIGVSAGGPAALCFVKEFVTKVHKLILESAVVKPWFHRFKFEYWVSRILFSPRNQKKFWQGLKKKLIQNEKKTIVKNLKIFTRLNPYKVYNNLSDPEKEMLKSFLFDNDSGEGFIYDIDHRVKKINTIAVPTLIMHSKNDGTVPFCHAQYAHKQICGSELFPAPVNSHFIYIGSGSDKVLRKRLDFLIQ
jgi:pimeloyl-ACP methyl ester carboxylesterase